MLNIANFFAFLDRPLYFCQFNIIGPNILWFSIQYVNLVEHLENAHAAINMKTVVGKPGMIIPIYPSERERTAIVKKMGLWIFKNSFGKNLLRMINKNIPAPM